MQEREARLLTVAEVAKYFRVDPESVRRWLRDGKLLGINLGRGPGWRIRLGDVEAFVAERYTSGRQKAKVDAANVLPAAEGEGLEAAS